MFETGLWTSLLMMAYVIVVVLVSLAVLTDNRQPAKTVAWLLVLIMVPVAGVVIFIFFGRSTRKEKYISQHSLDMLSRRSMAHFVEQRNLRIPESHTELIRQFANQNVALPFCDNEVEVYTSGYEFFPSLLEAIHNAQDHIHIITYIFEDDALGQMVADALIDKVREGVAVRLIYDDVGCWKVRNKFFERMEQEGIGVYAFMPVRFPALTSKVNYRNHRKICVIDGNVGFIGGMNIASRYVKGKKNQPWRDTHLRIRGRAVYGLQTAFLVDWYFVSRTMLADLNYFPPVEDVADGGGLAQIVTSDPISQWPELEQGYVRVLLEARKYVYMETPYFLPTESLIFALRTCALAGVDVRLLIPRHGDAVLVDWASRSFLDDVMEAGVKIYLYEKGFNHSKLLVSDDNLCSCGSANLDFRSFENNFESNAFIYDKATVAKIKQVFLDDMEHSIILDQDKFDHRPFLMRLGESAMRLFSPLL